jgi:hypothetical protein
MLDTQSANLQNLSKLLAGALLKNEGYLEALGVVRANSRGQIWLIGGGVYKTLLSLLYGGHLKTKDWDFIVEKMAEPLKLEGDWAVSLSRFGCPKLKKSNLAIDLIPLDNIHSVQVRGLEPDIQNYLSGTPFTIQSIAFDVDASLLIGDVGIKSLKTRTIGVNNEGEYRYARDMYGELYTPSHWADDLGLSAVKQ